ncbi:MAG: efflux RND transporter periplasmic adaptor subunit, partial [Porphyromonadaceae bacterium]|nr:efflux RND transporter periplasmic adaptor subunit [Porphyromonadaceae bacterium]
MKLKLSLSTIACALLSISLFSCNGKGSQGMAGGAREFAVMTLQPSPIEWYSSYPALIKGKQDIEIRPNVSGFLVELRVEQGSLLKKKKKKIVIDNVTYTEAL